MQVDDAQIFERNRRRLLRERLLIDKDVERLKQWTAKNEQLFAGYVEDEGKILQIDDAEVLPHLTLLLVCRFGTGVFVFYSWRCRVRPVLVPALPPWLTRSSCLWPPPHRGWAARPSTSIRRPTGSILCCSKATTSRFGTTAGRR